MKSLFIFFVAISFSQGVFAANYGPQDGIYSGKGSWSDTAGTTGTLNMTYSIANNVHDFAVKLSDGRHWEGQLKYEFLNSSDFNLLVGTMLIGQGQCTPDQCITTSMFGGPSGSVTQIDTFQKKSIHRSGAIKDPSTPSTFFDIELNKK